MKLQKLVDVLNETVKIEVDVDKDLPAEVKRLYNGDVGHLPEKGVIRDAKVLEVWPKVSEDGSLILHVDVSIDYVSLVIYIAEKLKWNESHSM